MPKCLGFDGPCNVDLQKAKRCGDCNARKIKAEQAEETLRFRMLNTIPDGPHTAYKTLDLMLKICE